MTKPFDYDMLLVPLAGIIFLIICVLLLNSFQSTMDGTEWRAEIYIVQSGESLWSIASKHCPRKEDRREWIDEGKALNGLKDAVIYPGQELIVLTPLQED